MAAERSEERVSLSKLEGGLTGLFEVGVKRLGRAAVASRVSKGK